MSENTSPTAFGAPYVYVTPNGATLIFPLLKMRQIAALQATVNANRVAVMRKFLDEFKVSPSEKAARLGSVELTPINMVELRMFAESPVGSLEVLKISTALEGDALDMVLAQMGLDDIPEAAVRVLGWLPPKKEDKPNPPPTDAK